MHERGVTRPMALADHDGADEHEGHGGYDAEEMVASHHRKTLWIPWTVVLLGLWLLTSPMTFGYGNEQLWSVPSGGRGVWFSEGTHDSLRASLMTWSDVVSGALLVLLGWRMLRPGRSVTWWAACLVGVWLVFAPVVLWSPLASAFLNDSIVGTLVIALTILIPGMPNMPAFMQMGGDTPPGWSYNPSSWPQRAILIGLGFAGLIVSRYLAAYQLGYVDAVWDPFFGFGGGTQRVLDSDMSQSWPISDAGLGAVAYTFEFLMGYMGGTARWRTMPWMVTIFGILVIPLGLAHITLVMSQPVMVHEWCTMCLLAAAIMLPMIPLEIDEVVAMLQHVRQARRRGDRGGSTWKVFWLGGDAEGATADERTPPLADLPAAPAHVAASSVWGASAPWTLVASAALGVWLLASPGVLGVDIRSGAADLGHIGGAAVLVLAVVAMGEVARTLRLANVAVGLGAAVLVWLIGAGVGFAVSTTLVGGAVAVMSLPRGEVRDSYGSWTATIR